MDYGRDGDLGHVDARGDEQGVTKILLPDLPFGVVALSGIPATGDS